MNAEQELIGDALRRIQELAERGEAHHQQMTQLASSPQFTEQYKREQRTAAGTAFNDYRLSTITAAAEALDRAHQTATQRLAQPGTPEVETRKARAAMRVSRLIDGGHSVGAVAEMLAETNDADGLRALRDEVPSWVMATLPTGDQGRRKGATEAALLDVDRRLEPLASGDEKTALGVRVLASQYRDQLTTTAAYSANPTGPNRIAQHYATNPPPVPEPVS